MNLNPFSFKYIFGEKLEEFFKDVGIKCGDLELSSENRKKYETIKEKFKSLSPTHLHGITHRIYFEKYLEADVEKEKLDNPNEIGDWNLQVGVLYITKSETFTYNEVGKMIGKKEKTLVYDTGYIEVFDDAILNKIESDYETIKSFFH